MRCEPVAIPGGVAIVCSRGRPPKPLLCETPTCRGRRAHFLCDYPVARRGRPSRCGRRLCQKCRHGASAGDDGARDYCPEHGRQLGLFG